MPAKILLIDDDVETLEMMSVHLRLQGYDVTTTSLGQEGLNAIKENQFDVVLTDLNLPDINGIEMVKLCKEASPNVEIIMITGYGSMEKAIEATKAGAFYYVEKPIDLDELQVLLEKAIERKTQAEEIKSLRERLSDRSSYSDIIGSSKAMQEIYEVIESVAESDANILIFGESGTGKELIANAIHYKSRRAKKPFVKVNCSTLPKELIESELFGHTKGAFTGANIEKMGLIGRADSGSLMLDEIGEMPLDLQPKLLRVLQERVYQRLGSEKPQEADFRLICATNREPMEAIREGILREDLYYRINTIEIRIPPLRERAEDIPRLADHFLQTYAEKYKRPVQSFSQQAYEKMFEYSWPGNVRELQNIIERAVLLSKNGIIDAASLPFVAEEKVAGATATGGSAIVTRQNPTALHNENSNLQSENNTVSQSATNTPSSTYNPISQEVSASEKSIEEIGKIIVNQIPDTKSGESQKDIFNEIERAVVKAALERTKGNKQAAANLLGLYRPRLYSMIKRHNLESKS